jgi:hypothetical protein
VFEDAGVVVGYVSELRAAFDVAEGVDVLFGMSLLSGKSA